LNFAQVFDLSVFDIGAVFALAFFVLRGAMRGITGEIISFFGLIASVFCGWVFAGPVTIKVLGYFPTWNPTVTEWPCVVVIFLGVSAAFAVFGKIVKVLVRATKLSFLDHIMEESVMGAVFGGLRTCVLVLFIYGAMSIFSPILLGEWVKDSVAMKGASVVWPTVFNIITDKGWIDPSQLTPQGTGALPDYLNSAPASNDI
jgi:uncharacterized membrane protein required for colicin V production